MPLSCAYGPSPSPTSGPDGDSAPIAHAASSFAHPSGIHMPLVSLGHPHATAFPFRGKEVDTFGCPTSTVDCGGSCTSTAQGHGAQRGAEMAGAAARLGHRHSSKRICESAQLGWRERGVMSLFGLSAQQHSLTWDRARSRLEKSCLSHLLLCPRSLCCPRPEDARSPPAAHEKLFIGRVARVHVAKPGSAFRPANPGGCSLPSRLSLGGHPPQGIRGAPTPGHSANVPFCQTCCRGGRERCKEFLNCLGEEAQSTSPGPPTRSAPAIAAIMPDLGCCIYCLGGTLSLGHWLLPPVLLLVPMPQAVMGWTKTPCEPLLLLSFSQTEPHLGLEEAKPTPRAPGSLCGSGRSLVSPGKWISPFIPVPRSPPGWDARRLPRAEPVPACSTWSHVRRGGSVSPCSRHVRNSYRPQPGAGAPRGLWEPQPRRGAAPWEPGLAGRIQAHAQRREQPASTSQDTDS